MRIGLDTKGAEMIVTGVKRHRAGFINNHSLASILIRTFRGTAELGPASGFLVSVNNRMFLVSNFHVFSGRQWTSPRILGLSSPEPDRVCLRLRLKNRWPDYDEDTSISLVNDDYTPRYVCMTEAGDAVRYIGSVGDAAIADIAILPVIIDETKYDVNCLVYPGNYEARSRPTITERLNILGFPFGMETYAGLPIWKVGEIASEPEICIFGQFAFLVDARTRQGMSGSPVYRQVRSRWRPWKRDLALVGVYSGRLIIPDGEKRRLTPQQVTTIESLGSDIGIVWRTELIALLLTLDQLVV